MLSNPITGRVFIDIGSTIHGDKPANPDPGLTVAIIIFCIVSPFWLTYRLVRRLVMKNESVSDYSLQVVK